MSVGALCHTARETVAWRRVKELLYSRSFLRDEKMRVAMDVYAACRDRKPPRQMRREMRRMKAFWHCTPHQYYLYECYRRSAALSPDDLEAYIPTYYFYHLFIPACEIGRHGAAYWSLLDDKCISESLFSALSIPQPETLAKVAGGRLYTARYDPLTDRDFEKLLAETAHPRIFCKTARGGRGIGVRACDRKPDGSYSPADGTVVSGDFFRGPANNGNYLIQAGVIQHPELAAIHPESVNTYRVVTCLGDEKPRIICAMLRMGRGGSVIDNASQGGIVVPVDDCTGIFGPAARSFRYESFPEHPDTGYAFAGRSAPHWDAVLDCALRAAGKLRQCTFIGWDIAVGSDGPLVLEANFGFSLQIHQMISGGLKEPFGIGDPDEYWTYRFGRHR
ncbi:MAG: hypothetical protein JXA08_09445 [Methanomicrobiaceae archaeon]|nr:hypothetical protein [Methanomicrobiaceae archaeon]